MAERKSIGEAMKMTPEKLAFIQGEGNSHKPTSVKERPSTEVEQVVEIDPVTQRVNRPKVAKRRDRMSELDAADVLDQLMVPMTMRLQHRTAQALKRASLELRLRRAEVASLQEIADEALSQWLTKHGFLE